jgi:hypothetical protein
MTGIGNAPPLGNFPPGSAPPPKTASRTYSTCASCPDYRRVGWDLSARRSSDTCARFGDNAAWFNDGKG